MKYTWEVTGHNWIGLHVPRWLRPLLRWVHEIMYPDHPDYNGGDY